MKSKYKIIYLVSAILSLAIVLIGRDNVARFFVGEPSRKVSLSAIRSEFSMIKIHEGDQWTESPIYFDKISIDGVKGYLRSKSSPEEIIDYYKSNVRALGWVEVVARKRNSGQSIKFCKNGISLFIDVLSGAREHADTDYYFGLVWTNDAGLDSYCQWR